ncbi:MAG: winged helix-turn-helix transcriptional regulator [Akkermansiaceae bacterium]|nr:winged helix-turn-helix transcriptional regulator [Akkermansiaceae bacterium]
MPEVTDAQLEELAERFKALSDPSRLAVLRRLMAGEAAVGEIAEDIGHSQPNVSRHLAALKRAGFVRGERDGQSIYYSISDPVVVKLCELLCGNPRAKRRAPGGRP